jgi:hypothetical protein
VDELRRIATARALAARPLAFAGTEQELPEPEREALLANSAATLDEQTRGQSGAGRTVCEPAAKRVVAEERDEGHAWNIGRARAPR